MATSPSETLPDTLALCLSGGGYRGMLFHLGTLTYLNDAGYLPKLDLVSSVSGGSITGGVLAMGWQGLGFDSAGKAVRFEELVVAPLRKVASTTIDVDPFMAKFFHGQDANAVLFSSLKKLVFGETSLQDLPDAPRFVFNATSVQTGALFRFSKAYLADYRVGRVLAPRRSLAEAVAASCACQPALSPANLAFEHADWSDLETDDCGRPPFTTTVVLTDGGIYDNLGMETAWKRCRRVLLSDGGGKYQPQEKPDQGWLPHFMRVDDTVDNQVRSLRKREIMKAFTSDDDPHRGAYWSMWTDATDYPAPSALAVPADHALELAHTPTRLAEVPRPLQDRLVNFGYAMAERAIRSYYDPGAFTATKFPCPGGV